MGRKEVLPILGMVIVQLAQVGQLVAGKKAMFDGMTNFTFAFYSNALASLILLPISILSHTSNPNPPPLTFSVFWKCLLFGMLGFLVQIFGYTGVQYASATLAASMMNLVPGFTFILAIIFRMEKADIKTSSTVAKIIGTLVSVLGAFIVTLYNGPQLLTSPSASPSNITHLLTQSQDWVLGGLLLAIDCVLASFFIIAQAIILKKYPARLVVTLFYSSVAAILSAVFSLTVEKDLSSWSLHTNVRLMAILYAGVFGASFQVAIAAWCLQRMGPLFVAMFNPLGIVLATVVGVTFLGDAFYLGSLVGSVVIVIGFYLFMWGNAKEGKVIEADKLESPLLQNNIVEETPVLV